MTKNPTLLRPELLAGLSGFAVLFALACLAGCGGGSGRTTGGSSTVTASRATGGATFSVRWPAPSRLIPVAANSIRVDVLRSGAVVATQLLTRPANGGIATASFASLPIDTLTARASAFPQADGTGTAQATGTVSFATQPDQTVPFTLTMASTIDHLTVAPTVTLSLAVGDHAPLTVTAWDAPGTGGNIVLIAPSTVQWVSSNPAVASVDASGLVTAATAGSATLTVTERESGKFATVGVSVAAPDPFAGVHEFLNLDLNNLPNYANPAFPVHYDNRVRSQDNTPPDNPVTNRGATLGRVLFYDKRLSINDAIACASCHIQPNGITDGRRFSPGFSGTEFTSAHAMRLGNIRFYVGQAMFWNKRAASVEAQATQPIQNSVEMGFDTAHGGMAALIAKMQALPYYPALFQWVYGDPAITEDRIQRAIAQFERSMVSVNSRFDAAFAQVFNPALPGANVGAPFPGFTPQEERGKQLFLTGPGQGGAGCATCHQIPTFALDANSHSNGLDAGETTVFKSPSLKNIAVTGPYMHDGRFATLEQVVDHYISGVQNGPALDNRLKAPNGQPQRLNLTTADRDALVAFMKTLTDPNLNADPRFSNPFLK